MNIFAADFCILYFVGTTPEFDDQVLSKFVPTINKNYMKMCHFCFAKVCGWEEHQIDTKTPQFI